MSGIKKCSYKDDLIHAIDKPAVIFNDGTEHWYQYGVKHRESGPAVTQPDGVQLWYLHGKLHREEGPAVVIPGVLTEWHRHGKLHKLNGPASIHADGKIIYAIEGEKITSAYIFMLNAGISHYHMMQIITKYGDFKQD
jgi:hypothetical protein